MSKWVCYYEHSSVPFKGERLCQNSSVNDNTFEKNCGSFKHFENSKNVPRIKTKINGTACGSKYLLIKPIS